MDTRFTKLLQIQYPIVQAGTNRPFAMNLFVPEKVVANPDEIRQMNEQLKPIRKRFWMGEDSRPA
ncbi:hypothetical protein [Alicyclobacillus suci]|uniref:hypothetical protein n=1 Tax=Alicyclobacillus suci TaxID=2816080 RepID=UPI001A8E6A7C|nr:hypothetical protein [Alicyclobacillus suci]